MKFMKTDILILGGGISGQLMAQRLSFDHPTLTFTIVDRGENTIHPFHLHRPIPEISSLANLKSAVLHVNIWDGKELKTEPSLMDINQYSIKIVGHIQINNLYSHGSIEIYPVVKKDLYFYDCFKDEIIEVDINGKIVYSKTAYCQYRYLINTISLPIFLQLAKVKHDINFTNYPIYVCKELIGKTNMYQMIYNTDKKSNITRVTLLDNELYIEAKRGDYKTNDLDFLSMIYGINNVSALNKISPGKIKPISNEQRKSFFYWLTQKYDIFCLGRYGAWTAKVANDVWDDSKQISNWIFEKEQINKFERRINDDKI